MRTSPKVSIIVPIYNVEKYLDRCVQSLLNQTLTDIEIIMVDDGSPDNCPRLCDEYSQKDSRIKVVHKPNGGLGYARNSGLKIATGEYVAFVDADDYVDTRMFETLYNEAILGNADAVYCGFKKEIRPNCFSNIHECTTRTEYEKKDIDNLILDFIASPPCYRSDYIHDMSVWHSIYRSILIKENSICFVSEREYASEDIPFQIDFLLRCDKIVFIPDILYFYCYNSGSLTKTFSVDKFYRVKALYKLLSDKSIDIDKEGLRSKRLFIGYTRSMIRLISQLPMSHKERISYIKIIVNDDAWEKLKKSYSPSLLPLHQRIMTTFIYLRKERMAYYYALLMENKLTRRLKQLKRVIFLGLYYGVATYLPSSYSPILGRFSNYMRVFCCRRIFRYCGKVSTIDRKAYFGTGRDIEIGDYSGIGEKCVIPNNTIIGKYVMMAPDVHIVANNHNFKDISKPMCFQGSSENHPVTIVEDDCWIGVRVIMTPGRHIKKGSIVAAGAVLTKDFDEYSIVGGNPAKLIRSRINGK